MRLYSSQHFNTTTTTSGFPSCIALLATASSNDQKHNSQDLFEGGVKVLEQEEGSDEEEQVHVVEDGEGGSGSLPPGWSSTWLVLRRMLSSFSLRDIMRSPTSDRFPVTSLRTVFSG